MRPGRMAMRLLAMFGGRAGVTLVVMLRRRAVGLRGLLVMVGSFFVSVAGHDGFSLGRIGARHRADGIVLLA